MQARVEGVAVLVVPGFIGLVDVLDKDFARIPVVDRAFQEISALQDQDAFAAWRQPLRQRGTAGTRADHDDIVVAINHELCLYMLRRRGPEYVREIGVHQDH